jgi:hypothetical protein
MIVKAIIVFQEFKKENPQKFDNLPVHFGQLEFRESVGFIYTKHSFIISFNTIWLLNTLFLPTSSTLKSYIT